MLRLKQLLIEYERLKSLKDGKYGTNNKYLNSILEKITEFKGKTFKNVMEVQKVNDKFLAVYARLDSYTQFHKDLKFLFDSENTWKSQNSRK